MKTLIERRASLRAELVALRAKEEELRVALDRDEKAIERLVAEAQREAGAALLDGRAAPETRVARRRAKAERLQESVAAACGALAVLPERIATVEAELTEAGRAIADATLDRTCAQRAAASDRIREGLRALAVPLAELIAADRVEEAQLGHGFSFDPARHALFSGRIVAEKFLTAIPKRLASSEIEMVAVSEAAEALAARFGNEIEGN